MKNNIKYQRLRFNEREEISVMLSEGRSFSDIAKWLNRSISTISREVNSNCLYKRCYRAGKAQEKMLEIKHRSKQTKKIDANELLKNYIIEHLKLSWSPEQIAKRLKFKYPNNNDMNISHETIYAYLYCLPRGELKKALLKCLRQERKLRHKRKNNHQKRSSIVDAISISERPKEVENRIIPGHWEGDLIVGKNSASALGTLVERTTRYTMLIPLIEKDAKAVRKAFAKAAKKIPKYLKKTMTYDRGLEMAEHKLFTEETKIKVYFADPYSPWQRGTNENTNGLIRQYFPKGTDFKLVPKHLIQEVQDQLNDRPRKALKFYKPNEVFNQLINNPNFALDG
jgi:IS30 family transposase